MFTPHRGSKLGRQIRVFLFYLAISILVFLYGSLLGLTGYLLFKP